MPDVSTITFSQMVNILFWAAIIYTVVCLVVAVVSKEHRHALLYAFYGMIAIAVSYIVALIVNAKGVH